MPETIHRPTTPYVGPVHCSLHDGMKIKVSVKIERNHDGFQINLQCGPSTSPRSDVAFLFNPRFGQKQVVRNSLINGVWGTEELHGSFPFNKGFTYEVVILVKSHQYQVSVAGRHLCDYTHRIPMDRVSHITVEQGVEIRKITFEPDRHKNKSMIHHHTHHGGIGFDMHHDSDDDLGMHHHDMDMPHHDIDMHHTDINMHGPAIDGINDMMSSAGNFFGGMFSNIQKNATKTAFSTTVSGGKSSMKFETDMPKQPNAPPAGGLVYPPSSTYPNNPGYLGQTPYPQTTPYPGNPPAAGSVGYPTATPYPGNPPPAGSFPGNGTGYQGNSFPAGAAAPYPGTGTPNAPMNNPPVPFQFNLGALYPGKMVFIGGIVHPNPSRFNVNFVRGPTGDVAFTFDARFNYGNDRQELVRNTKQGGSWGAEERQKCFFPFQPNGVFEIVVLVEANCFKVAVNNQHLLEYNHRIQPLTCVDTLKIDGDLKLTQVKVQ